MFNGEGSQYIITGGAFEFNNIDESRQHAHFDRVRAIRQLLGASAPGALYNSRERFDPPKCHPNTRVAVLERLVDWAEGKVDPDAIMMWLYGDAGAGKSAIAHTLSEICAQKRYLLASFFFSKGAAGRNTEAPLIATIAYQVAMAIPAARGLIEGVLEKNPMIFDQSMETQLSELIITPIRTLSFRGVIPQGFPFLIIIDGLDECSGGDVQCHIIRAIATTLGQCGLWLRVLITSRPETIIRTAFNSRSLQPLLTRLALSDSFDPDEDILRFLDDSFESMKHEHPLAHILPPSWPSTQVIHQLVENSSGQFIYASTVIRYISSLSHRPPDRLDVILGIRPPEGARNLPFAELNALYMHIFSTVEDIKKLQQVLGVIFVYNAIVRKVYDGIENANKMDSFLRWPLGETQLRLNQLASVIECDDAGRISVKHASLSDFLLDPSRSRQFSLQHDLLLSDYMCLLLHHIRGNEDRNFPSWIQYRCIPELLKAGAVVTKKVHEEFQQLSLVRLRDRGFGVSYFWAQASELLEVLQNRGLHDLHACHVSAIRDVVLSLLQQHPGDTNILLSAYILCYNERHFGYFRFEGLESFFISVVGQKMWNFDGRYGFGLSYSLLRSKFPLARILVNDPTLRSYAFCGQSHAAIALYCLRCIISDW